MSALDLLKKAYQQVRVGDDILNFPDWMSKDQIKDAINNKLTGKNTRPAAFDSRKQAKDYTGVHEAPYRDAEGYHASLDDVSPMYGDDIYTGNAKRYYSQSPADDDAINIIQQAANNPEKEITLFRAVPKDAPDTMQRGDWVAITEEYAKEHGSRYIDGDYKVLELKTKAKNIFTDGNSPSEWGFDPKSIMAMSATGLLANEVYNNDAEAGVITKGGKKLIEAWHGTPHSFKKFDINKIGTGEGAQAYGHGLYAADSKSVGKSYRDELSGYEKNNRNTFNLYDSEGGFVDLDWNAINDEAGFALANAGGSHNKAISSIDSLHHLNDGERSAIQKVLRDWKKEDVNVKSTGSLYKTHIDATPDELLDWDKPLSEQPQAVRDRLSEYSRVNKDRIMERVNSYGGSDGFNLVDERGSFYVEADNSMFNEFAEFKTREDAVKWLDERVDKYSQDTVKGADVYRQMVSDEGHQNLGQIGASKALKDKGIKGIQYNDGMSRGADGGNNTKNYVIFDDKIMHIAKKYGIAASAVTPLMVANEEKNLADTLTNTAQLAPVENQVIPEAATFTDASNDLVSDALINLGFNKNRAHDNADWLNIIAGFNPLLGAIQFGSDVGHGAHWAKEYIKNNHLFDNPLFNE